MCRSFISQGTLDMLGCSAISTQGQGRLWQIRNSLRYVKGPCCCASCLLRAHTIVQKDLEVSLDSICRALIIGVGSRNATFQGQRVAPDHHPIVLAL